jgi:hypothetical protein
MLNRFARLTILSLGLLVSVAAASPAAGRENRPDLRRQSGRELLAAPGKIWEWVAHLVAPGASRGEVRPKCSAGIDPDGKPCVMPSTGCRCEP